MKENPWLERGIDELHKGHWFDGFQILQGALQRAFRLNQPNDAEHIISEATAIFASGNQTKLACDLVLALIITIRQRLNDLVYARLIPFCISELRKASLETCVRTVCNQIMMENSFRGSEFLLHLNNFILKANYEKSVVSDLYYCYAGLLCYKKDFVSCFKTLNSWSQEFSPLPPKMRVYLTLAEINAYEIEGCGKFLISEESLNSYDPETESYLEIANKIFGSVQTLNNSEFHSIISDYSDLINSKTDGLLKALCDGISEIFNNNSSSGLFSLFRK